MRRVTGNAAHLRIVLLENKRLVPVHLRVVKPPVQRRMRKEIDLAASIRIADFTQLEVGGGDRLRIADGKGRIHDAAANGPPNIDDAVALDRICLGDITKHESEALAARALGVVVVDTPGGGRLRPIAMSPERERRVARLPLANLVVEDISALSAGHCAGEICALFVVHIADFVVVAKVGDFGRGVPELKAAGMDRGCSRKTARVRDPDRVDLVLAVVLRRAIGRLVHVVVEQLGAWRNVRDTSEHRRNVRGHSSEVPAQRGFDAQAGPPTPKTLCDAAAQRRLHHHARLDPHQCERRAGARGDERKPVVCDAKGIAGLEEHVFRAAVLSEPH